MNSQSNIILHLTGFVDSFIKSEYQTRWKHILIDKPEKSINELKKFERHFNESYCNLIEPKEIEQLKKTHLNTTALYYDGESDLQFLRVPDAIILAKRAFRDAIISISPGRESIFLFHEGWGWYCKRN